MSISTLTDIAFQTGTDKVIGSHIWFNKNYMNVYEKYFEEFRYAPIKFLEIGVLNGASLRAWRQYFPNAEIHGIDIRPECKSHEDVSNNIFVHIIDCSNSNLLEEFKEKYTKYFDVILDDGSHINDITLLTFQKLYHCVKSTGYYIVEDLGCAYIGSDLPNHTPHWPGISHMKQKYLTNDPSSILELYKQLHIYIDNVSKDNPYQIEFLHHWTYIVVLKKNEHYLHNELPF